MYIQPVDSNNNVSMYGYNWKKYKNKLVQAILDVIPNHTVNDSVPKIDKWEKFNYYTSRPDINRGIMGATALVTQPIIDMHNHKVDEDTRRVSRNRTIAKIIAGTLVGIFVVRGPVYKIVQHMTDVRKNTKYSNYLLPKKFLKEITENSDFLKNHRNALSMGIALLAMCVTNFVLDAPLTAILTNILNKKTEDNINEK